MTTDRKRQAAEQQLEKLFDAHSASADTPSKELTAALHMKLVTLSESARTESQNAPSRLWGFKIASSFVLLALIIATVVLFDTTPDTETPQSERTLIAESEVERGAVTISLNFAAKSELEGVHFSIALPQGVRFNTDNKVLANTRNHEWVATLKSGENSIPFVVSVDEIGVYAISVVADYNGFRHTQEIVLTAGEKSIKVAYYRHSKTPLKI
ncbi:hypothetical protein KAH37_07510 [bacterium]|nr:hypothetical protein [bacterium]